MFTIAIVIKNKANEHGNVCRGASTNTHLYQLSNITSMQFASLILSLSRCLSVSLTIKRNKFNTKKILLSHQRQWESKKRFKGKTGRKVKISIILQYRNRAPRVMRRRCCREKKEINLIVIQLKLLFGNAFRYSFHYCLCALFRA